MRKTVCPFCGSIMYDDEYSVRHRCQFCKQFIPGWREKLHEELKEHFPNDTMAELVRQRIANP